MKTFRQLFRQPMKFLSGILLMTLATSILCVTVGQALAAKSTKEVLNQRFSTIAIPLVQESIEGDVFLDSFLLEEELLAWVENMAVQHPDIVQGMAKHGILSAYIPELTPYNPTIEHFQSDIDIQISGSSILPVSYSKLQASPYNMPYSNAMLVITLEEVYQPDELWEDFVCEPIRLQENDFDTKSEYLAYLDSLESTSVMTGYEVLLTGTVTQVVALQDGYRDTVGRTACLTLHVPTLEAFAAMDLVPGEEYIVYGMNYVDEHMELTGMLEALDLVDRQMMDPFNPDLLYVFTEEEVEENFGLFAATYAGVKLHWTWYAQLNAISMTLADPTALLQYEEIRDADGYLQELVEKTQFTVTDTSGETITLSKEEYAQRYKVPTIARLDDSVEKYLNSQEGTVWRTALERTEINNHAFAVIGVDKMDYLCEFSLQRSRIVEGRDFTKAERQNGTRVCLIHELLAQNAGLSVGDTITLNLYSTDNALPYQSFRGDGRGILNPTASFYFETTPFMETAEYTIVGIWRGETWPVLKDDPYAYSANTVFVPKSSVHSQMEECDSIIFNTIILENGKISAFHELAINSAYAGRFNYNDQDYSTVAANFHNYDSLSRQVFKTGVAIYVILLFLYLLLYPASQRKGVRTMQSLGCTFGKRFGHVMTASLATLVPAAALGIMLGLRLWDKVVAALQATAESTVALHFDPNVLIFLAAAQLALALVLNILVAIFVAAPRGISRRA